MCRGYGAGSDSYTQLENMQIQMFELLIDMLWLLLTDLIIYCWNSAQTKNIYPPQIPLTTYIFAEHFVFFMPLPLLFK